MQKNLKIGWIGLGVMGAPMCEHLIDAGYSLNICTRTKNKAASVIDKGAAWRDTPAAVCAESDIIVTMVGTGAEVRDVYFSDSGLFVHDITGKLFIDMGTTAPSLTMEIAGYCAEHGADSVDAPVSGGDTGARNATLSIMAGGSDAALTRARQLFTTLGSYRHIGPHGSGQHCKMSNQIVVAGTMIGVCESLVYASKAGLDADALIAAISSGAAACWALDNLAPRIKVEDYTPGFMVDHFIKDLGIAIDECELMGIELPGLALARQLYTKLSEMGHGKSGTQALVLALSGWHNS